MWFETLGAAELKERFPEAIYEVDEVLVLRLVSQAIDKQCSTRWDIGLGWFRF